MRFPHMHQEASTGELTGTLSCSNCNNAVLLEVEKCPHCQTENILSCLDIEELKKISTVSRLMNKTYQEDVEQLLLAKGVAIEKIEEFKNSQSKQVESNDETKTKMKSSTKIRWSIVILVVVYGFAFWSAHNNVKNTVTDLLAENKIVVDVESGNSQ